jgi:hypothetical protein
LEAEFRSLATHFGFGFPYGFLVGDSLTNGINQNCNDAAKFGPYKTSKVFPLTNGINQNCNDAAKFGPYKTV